MNTIKWVSCMALITIIALSLMGCGTREAKTLKALAKKRQVQKVYIEEQEGYATYLVLSDNYDGKVLLLREQVLPELMKYKEHNDLWGHYEYGSYYERSSLDAYLNRELSGVRSTSIRKSSAKILLMGAGRTIRPVFHNAACEQAPAAYVSQSEHCSSTSSLPM